MPRALPERMTAVTQSSQTADYDPAHPTGRSIAELLTRVRHTAHALLERGPSAAVESDVDRFRVSYGAPSACSHHCHAPDLRSPIFDLDGVRGHMGGGSRLLSIAIGPRINKLQLCVRLAGMQSIVPAERGIGRICSDIGYRNAAWAHSHTASWTQAHSCTKGVNVRACEVTMHIPKVRSGGDHLRGQVDAAVPAHVYTWYCTWTNCITAVRAAIYQLAVRKHLLTPSQL